jgi:hypothetical protein
MQAVGTGSSLLSKHPPVQESLKDAIFIANWGVHDRFYPGATNGRIAGQFRRLLKNAIFALGA